MVMAMTHSVPAEKWDADRKGKHVSDLAKADARLSNGEMFQDGPNYVVANIHGPAGTIHRRFPMEHMAGNTSGLELLAVGVSGTPHGPLKLSAYYWKDGTAFIYRQNTQSEAKVSGKFLDHTLKDWAERLTAVLWFDADRVEVAPTEPDGDDGDQ